MTWVTVTSIKRLSKREMRSGVCDRCKSRLLILATGRSIWNRPFNGGSGEVRRVGEVYCPKCEGEPELPIFGAPIYEDQILQAKSGPLRSIG